MVVHIRAIAIVFVTVFVNSVPCKDPKTVNEADFFFSGLEKMGNTSNAFGSTVTPVTVAQILGLNTLGISLARIDYAPFGLNPLHTHPRGTEILYVVEGMLQVGFVTSSKNTFISKVLQKGDVFVFPVGLTHFQWNVGSTYATAIVALTIPNSLFGSKPDIASDVLDKAFHISNTFVNQIKSRFT